MSIYNSKLSDNTAADVSDSCNTHCILVLTFVLTLMLHFPRPEMELFSRPGSLLHFDAIYCQRIRRLVHHCLRQDVSPFRHYCSHPEIPILTLVLTLMLHIRRPEMQLYFRVAQSTLLIIRL